MNNSNYKIKRDKIFMNLALKLAKNALNKDEVPVGAIIVSDDNKIIGKGYNRVEHKKCQNSHAEMIAIEKAAKKLKNWRLNNCTIYVTLEPCIMCFGLISLSRISRIVYGIKSKLFGSNLNSYAENLNIPDEYKKHIKCINSGLLEKKIRLLLSEFFDKKRNKKN